MTSMTTPLYRLLIRALAAVTLNADLPLTTQRRRMDGLGKLTLPPRGMQKQESELGGVRAVRVSGRWTQAEGPVLLYIHGGAFIIGSPESHLNMVGYIARAAVGEAWLIDYRLAPEHPAPAAIEDGVAAYQALLDQGVPSSRIIIAGDSAGGCLTLSVTQACRDRGLPMPAGMAMLSPIVDAQLTSPTMTVDDPVLAEPWMVCGMQHYAGDLPRTDPRISPIFAEMQGLPPALIHVGTQEKLLDDSRRLRQVLEQAGIACEYREEKGLWHVWHFLAGGGFSRARAAVKSLGLWCQNRIQTRPG